MGSPHGREPTVSIWGGATGHPRWPPEVTGRAGYLGLAHRVAEATRNRVEEIDVAETIAVRPREDVTVAEAGVKASETRRGTTSAGAHESGR